MLSVRRHTATTINLHVVGVPVTPVITSRSVSCISHAAGLPAKHLAKQFGTFREWWWVVVVVVMVVVVGVVVVEGWSGCYA